MPKLGEIQRGKELGKKGIWSKFIWSACVDCGEERWVMLKKGEPKNKRCHSCGYADPERNAKISRIQKGIRHPCGEKHHNWKGGKKRDKQGYIHVKLQPNDFFYPMTNPEGYVREHRLVVAKALGRCLQSWEIVHHKDGYTKDDNRYPETLQLVSDLGHRQITVMELKIARLEKRVTVLEAENCLLQKELARAVEVRVSNQIE
jgi:hypothetical protein